jgi:hypothetical protein
MNECLADTDGARASRQRPEWGISCRHGSPAANDRCGAKTLANPKQDRVNLPLFRADDPRWHRVATCRLFPHRTMASNLMVARLNQEGT